MLRAVGFKDADFKKPRSASPRPGAWSRRATCTSTSWRATRPQGVDDAGGKAIDLQHHHHLRRHLDGHRGHELLARLARSHRRLDRNRRRAAQGFDGVVAIGGCDKNMPGCLMAHGAAEPPGVFVYGGTILPGCSDGASRRHRLGLRSRRPACRAARSTTRELHEIERMRDPRRRLAAAACTPRTPWPPPSRRWA